VSDRNGGRPQSAAQLEAEIADRRAHLAKTVDELVARAKPRAIAQRSVAGAKQRFAAATRTETGALRTERLAAMGVALVAVIALFAVVRRASDRRRHPARLAGRGHDD